MNTPPCAVEAATLALRPAAERDVVALGGIERDAFTDPWPEDAFREFLDRSHVRMTVAADEHDTPIGYCVMIIVEDEAEIANVAVAERCRRRGVAGRLLDDAISYARTNGVAAMYLEVRKSNAPAKALYQSRGFRMVGRRKGYYQHPTEDALILRWLASNP